MNSSFSSRTLRALTTTLRKNVEYYLVLKVAVGRLCKDITEQLEFAHMECRRRGCLGSNGRRLSDAKDFIELGDKVISLVQTFG